MVERLKKIPTHLLEIWNKYTAKQKTIIISVTAGLFLALVILFFVMGRTKYQVLRQCESSKEASKIVDLLDGEGIKHKLANDNVTVSVDKDKYSKAVLLLASNDVPTTGLTMNQLLDNNLNTTNSDRTLKLNLYVQNQLQTYISSMEGVKACQVSYIPVDTSNSILSESQDTSASVLLTVEDDFKQETAETIAELVASVIGDASTDKIKVVDQNGNLLFSGASDLYLGTASTNEDYKERLRNTYVNNLYLGLLKLGYDDAEIMPNLMFNMDKVSELYTEYSPAEGQEQGLYSHSYTYETEGATGAGGPAGTASNDDTEYLTQDGSTSNQSTNIKEYNYLPNNRVTNTEYEYGAIVPDKSSISIVLTDIVTYQEDDLKRTGVLKGTTFKDYALNNSARTKINVDQDVYTLVSMATGISTDNITIIAYQQPMFVPAVKDGKTVKDYLPYILVVLIVALLGFVVFKTIAPVEVTETEPELSVEELLATTKENQSLNDIEFEDKSEIRKMIEKFVDENPEAVASLLRNWLNDDWQ